MNAKPNAPRRRWYQFSLRTALIVMLLSGPALGMAGPPAYHTVHNWLYPPQVQNFYFFVGMSR
ncbi:MAG: hypothetical protein K8T25_22065 [Planctomycetia bacterium]|nr:hypothetical protein [Planctomycetia bacterium]